MWVGQIGKEWVEVEEECDVTSALSPKDTVIPIRIASDLS